MEVLGAIGFIVALIVAVVLAMFVLLRNPGASSDSSKYVVNHFEPDNTAPKLTDLIEFHKKSDTKIKYNIERD